MSSAQVTNIDVAYPEAGDLHLRLGVGACRLRITPGEGGAWVTGSYRDPSGALPPRVHLEGGTARITQEYNVAEVFGLFSGVPSFDLALGKARPYSLAVESGASDNALDLGGLPLDRLTVRQGAGRMEIDFSAPNPHPMSHLDVAAGAGEMRVRNLANANCADVNIEGGAALYRLNFGGTLQRDTRARVSTGMSSVEILVPATTAARISSESLLGGLDVGDGFMKREGAFWTEAALAGRTPVLTIRVNVALGALSIRTG